MAFRRSNSFRRRSVSFRSRSPFARTRMGVRPQKWEVATFFIDNQQTLPSGSASETLQYFHLGSIGNSLAGDQVTEPEGRVGNVLGNMNRFLIIGGIVMEHWFQHNGAIPGNFVADPQQTGTFYVEHGLLIDRQINNITNGVIPGSIGSWSPFTTDFPIASLTSTAPVTAAEQNRGPTRVLYHRNGYVMAAPRQVQNTMEGTLYVTNEQHLSSFRYLLNRRLRLRLNDEMGLYAYAATRNSATFNLATNERRVAHCFRGTLYYRFTQ